MTAVPRRGIPLLQPLWRDRRPASVLGVLVECVGLGLAIALLVAPFADHRADVVRFLALFCGVRLLVGLALLWKRRDAPAASA